MQKKLLFSLIMGICASRVSAQDVSYIDEIRALGSVAGQGLACNASKYDTFEWLARAILISKAPNDSMQAQAMYAYNEEKANAYMSKQMDGMFDCAEINRRFNAQQIFQAVLYADGTIKMPDGTIIKPRQAYDASVIYKKDGDKQRQLAKKIYDKGSEVKVGEVKIKAEGNAEVQTVTPPKKVSVSLPSGSQSVSGTRSVEPSPSVEEHPASKSTVVKNDTIGHIKSKW